ncbi:hypothetical protein EJB05_36955 [Eragrostis curvula]|uniref:F-box domain-containing protein n=1 Tax=Eragrostis curvula TaxID=38414 RepID=A0A5J9TZP7_9POAL|nr:hypothetical protein EJB05_36955 [Eragrostis curvula]
MPQRCGSNKAATASRGDSFSAIPDDVIRRLLGFLPALDAVRTCVLARRWLTLWRYVPRLRIADVEALGSVCRLNTFVNRVLLLRETGCPLDDCEFDLRGLPFLDRVCIDQWMRHTLICHVRLLRVRVYADERVGIADWPLLSKHLITLELEGLVLEGSFPDFSGCLVLEDLKITNCLIDTDIILSQSLKHLKITACELCWRKIPTHISAPNLVSLKLDDYGGVTPILESMPLLETASVNLGQNNEEYCDFCDKGESVDCTCDMCIIYYANDRRNDVCVLLGGLSSATQLELKASPKMRPKPGMEMDSSNLMEQSLMLQQLKVVKVKCQIIDERVHNVLKILRSCGLKESSAQEV